MARRICFHECEFPVLFLVDMLASVCPILYICVIACLSGARHMYVYMSVSLWCGYICASVGVSP